MYTFVDGTGKLVSISKNGTLNWEHTFRDFIWSDPVISKEGIIYIGFNISKTICALNKQGELLWQRSFGKEVAPSSINVTEDGTLYLCQDGTLYALNPDCSIKWEYNPEKGHVIGGPAIDSKGNLYLNLTPYLLISLDCDGNERWRQEIKNAPLRTAIIGNNGILFQESSKENYPQFQSWIETFTTEGEKRDTYEVKGTILSTILVDDNLLYALTNIYTYKKGGWKDKVDVKWELHVIGSESTDIIPCQ